MSNYPESRRRPAALSVHPWGSRAAISALLTAVVLGACASGVAARPAQAATSPCWKQVLADWSDGRLDSVYPIPCYQSALVEFARGLAGIRHGR